MLLVPIVSVSDPSESVPRHLARLAPSWSADLSGDTRCRCGRARWSRLRLRLVIAGLRRRGIDLAQIDLHPVLQLARLLDADASRLRQTLEVLFLVDLLNRGIA